MHSLHYKSRELHNINGPGIDHKLYGEIANSGALKEHANLCMSSNNPEDIP